MKGDAMSISNEIWKGKHYACHTNKECEFYPCHELKEGKTFNCLFCYCPLFCLGHDCGGNFKYLDNGFKDCSNCQLPHDPDNYGYIIDKFSKIISKMAEDEKNRH